MLVLDNTIAAYGVQFPDENVLSWAAELRSRGIELCIVSNSNRKERVGAFSNALGTGAVFGARKPSPKGLRRAMSEAGYAACVSAFVGDQVFTDTIAANAAGAVSIIVKPLRFTNPLLAIRYAFEAPFRAMCRNKYD